MSKKQICPIMSHRIEVYDDEGDESPGIVKCCEEQCAWWHIGDKECSITQLGWIKDIKHKEETL